MLYTAGFVTILTYILNYYSGVDIELRDHRGFTALIKAALQGNNDCVASLLMAGKIVYPISPHLSNFLSPPNS